MRRIYGFREWLPEEASNRRGIEAGLRELLGHSGYREVRVPLVAPATSGGGYRLMGDDGQVVALRNDFTGPVATMAAESLRSQPRPLRLCYAGPVFRAAEPTSNDRVELWQVGAEVFGGVPDADREVVSLAVAGLAVARAPGNSRLVLGDIGLAESVLSSAGLQQEARSRALGLLASGDAVRAESIIRQSAGRGVDLEPVLDLLTYAGHQQQICKRWTQLGRDLDELETLLELGNSQAAETLYALGLVPSLPYYTGLVFEVFAGDCPAPLARGGRYDALTRDSQLPEPAAGLAWDLDNMLAVFRPGIARPFHASIH